MADRYRTAYNTTDRPVVIDDEGRIAAGGEWTPVLASSEQVRAAVERRELVFVDEPGDHDEKTDPAADRAFKAAAELNAAAGPEELAEVADKVDATPTPAAKRARAADKAEEVK